MNMHIKLMNTLVNWLIDTMSSTRTFLTLIFCKGYLAFKQLLTG